MLRQLLATVLFIPLLLGCALQGASAAPPLSPDQRAIRPDQRELVAETCDQVMGLGHGGLYRGECMDSLARSLAVRAEGARLASSFSACRSRGLSEGTAAFSTCMLDNPGEGRTAAAAPLKLAHDTAAPESAKSYFNVNNSSRWRREQYSCAQIGLTPGSAAFGQCVASLDASLMPNGF